MNPPQLDPMNVSDMTKDILLQTLLATTPFTQSIMETINFLYDPLTPDQLFQGLCETTSKEVLAYLLTKMPPNQVDIDGSTVLVQYISYYMYYSNCTTEEWLLEKVKIFLAHGVRADLPNHRQQTALKVIYDTEKLGVCNSSDHLKLINLLESS